MNSSRVPTAERLSADPGKKNGAWIGWHREIGWVFLDRRDGRNASRAEPLTFVRADTWAVFKDDRANWNPPLYVYWKRRIEKLEPSALADQASSLEKLCQEYEHRVSQLLAPLDSAIEEARRQKILNSSGLSQIAEAIARGDSRMENLERNELKRAERISVLLEQARKRQQLEGQAIRAFLQERGVRNVIHFTRGENLESILRHGVVPRANLQDGQFTCNDGKRRDGYTEASCLSLSYPNYKMFYSCREREREARWAVLIINPEILIAKPCLYFPSNAATMEWSDMDGEGLSNLMGLAGLQGMFGEAQEGLRAQLGIDESFTTNPQAEVLIFDLIEPAQINEVHVTDPHFLNEVQRLGTRHEVRHDSLFFGSVEFRVGHAA